MPFIKLANTPLMTKGAANNGKANRYHQKDYHHHQGKIREKVPGLR